LVGADQTLQGNEEKPPQLGQIRVRDSGSHGRLHLPRASASPHPAMFLISPLDTYPSLRVRAAPRDSMETSMQPWQAFGVTSRSFGARTHAVVLRGSRTTPVTNA
jgi:hypothetical protein